VSDLTPGSGVVTLRLRWCRAKSGPHAALTSLIGTDAHGIQPDLDGPHGGTNKVVIGFDRGFYKVMVGLTREYQGPRSFVRHPLVERREDVSYA